MGLVAVALSALAAACVAERGNLESTSSEQAAASVATFSAAPTYVKASNTDAIDYFGQALALSGSGTTLVVGAPNEASAATGVNGNQSDNSAPAAGGVYVLGLSGSPATWSHQAYLKASNTGREDNFGYAVAISADGNTIAAGAWKEDGSAATINGANDDLLTDAGAVYVFVRSGSSWVQQAYVKPSNPGAGDVFGHSVALSSDGNTLAVGAFGEDGSATGVNGTPDENAMESGAAYVFTRSGTTWTQQAYVKASNTGGLSVPPYGDRFGAKVALSSDGNTLAVAAPTETSNATGINGNGADNSATNAGAAYVFTRSGSTWAQQAYVKASNTEANDYFGSSISLSADGNKLIVSAPGESSAAIGVNGNQSDNSASNAGAAYVYVRNAGSWAQQAYVKPSNTAAGESFGEVSFAGDGNSFVVAAAEENGAATGTNGNQSLLTATNAGAAYVFRWTGSTWSQSNYVKASNTDAGDFFGASVALSSDGSNMAVGAMSEASSGTGVNSATQSNNSAPNAGAVYVYGATTTLTFDQQAYVKASNTGALDSFGRTSDISGDGNVLAVGSAYEDSNATGVNGNQLNELATDSGAVYVYGKVGGTWAQTAYVKASNTQAGDRFGYAVRLSSDGTTLAVGAYAEDSAATGINGNASDNSAMDSGAVYVFVNSGGVWSQQAYLKASNTGAGDYFGMELDLSLDGNTLVVGAPFEDGSNPGINPTSNDSAADAGAAYIFTRSGGVWTQKAYVKASNPGAGDEFGYIKCVALSDDGATLAIGALGEDSSATGVNGNQALNDASNSGAAYVFAKDASGNWSQQAYLKASNTGANDAFGATALGSGNMLVVGASGEDGNGSSQSDNSLAESGAAYTFLRSGTSWSSGRYIKPPSISAGDQFGGRLALASNTPYPSLAIGTTGEDSKALGVNGNYGDESAPSSGAVWLFDLVSFRVREYVKASNTAAFDSFGASLALSTDGRTLVAGAGDEDSNATGVNGDQSNNSSSGSGAVYVFTR